MARLDKYIDNIVRISPKADFAKMSMDSREGFILSRVDGTTSMSNLFKICSMDRAEAETILEGLLKKGAVEIEGMEAPPEPPAAEIPAVEKAAPAGPDANPIPPEKMKRIDFFHSNIDKWDHHEVLEVPRDATLKDIKKSYFRLSKEFHPDNYFRKNIGAYKPKLDEIFKRVSEAYESLSSPRTAPDNPPPDKIHPKSEPAQTGVRKPFKIKKAVPHGAKPK